MTYGRKARRLSLESCPHRSPGYTEGDYLGAITLGCRSVPVHLRRLREIFHRRRQPATTTSWIPKTGYPVWNGLTSVTIVCGQGYLADGLSTACFVLGMDASKPLLEKYGAEAVFVDEDKNIYVTSGLMDKFELMKDGYTVNEA